MKTPKNPPGQKIVPAVAIAAIVLLAAGAVFVFRSYRLAENAGTPQTATDAASRLHSDAPRSAAVVTAPTEPAADANSVATANRAALQFPSFPLPAENIAAATATATTNNAALATLPSRQRALLDKIPDARFREDFLKLAPEARAHAAKILASARVPDADYAELHFTASGLLYYVCALLPSDATSSGNAVSSSIQNPESKIQNSSVPVTQPPVRHSRPSSRNILFLDFGGGDIAGTAWNNLLDTGPVPVYQATPYDIDGDPATFSDQEQQNIIEIWERVAEDYSPFDVDVTTEHPAPDILARRTTGHALITSTTDKNGLTMPSGDTSGGVGLLNVFGEYDYAAASPVFIYYNALNYSPANIAYAASHELGHNLGLSHMGPGFTLGDGDPYGYYLGHGYGATSWAPIMGAGYGNSVVSWTKGDYYGANNHEDELAIISGKLGYIPELAATTFATALPLTPAGACGEGPLGDAGIIRQGGNTHYYTFTLASATPISITLNPAQLTRYNTIVGNADLQLDVLDANGNPDGTGNPPDTLNVTLTGTLDPGQWYLRVTTGSAGNPASPNPTGYTAYGSIGQYTLLTTYTPTPIPLPAALSGYTIWTTPPVPPATPASDLTWQTQPGSAPGSDWFGVIYGTPGTPLAAQSGSIAPGQYTGITTTIEGTGTLAYSRAFTSDARDTLTLTITDLTTNITTTPDTTPGNNGGWRQLFIPITTPGPNQITWTYTRSPYSNPPAAIGNIGAWLSEVIWAPDTPFTITPASKEAPAAASHFTVTIDTDKTWTSTTTDPWLSANAAGTGPSTLNVTCAQNDTSAPRTGYIAITSGGITRTLSVAQRVHIPLATALGSDLDWQTGGDANWFADTITTATDTTTGAPRPYSARSGIISGVVQPSANPYTDMGQQTTLHATVTGPGILDFNWKVSSEAQATDDTGTWGDILHFYIDDQERACTSGEQNWTHYTTAITTPGPHTLTWTYQKDPYLSVGADAAWLDQVIWTPGTVAPTLNLSPNALAVPATQNDIPLIIDSNIAWNATTTAPWLTITTDTANAPATHTLTYAANPTTQTRTAVITLASADGALTVTSTITQDPGGTLTLNPETMQAPAPKGTLALVVTANVAWTATTSAPWLTVTPATGNSTAPLTVASTLTVAYAANTATTTRTGNITLTSGDLTATCLVTQAAATTGTTGGGNGGGNNNGGGGSNSGGGGGGGAPSLWSLLALCALLGIRAVKRRT